MHDVQDDGLTRLPKKKHRTTHEDIANLLLGVGVLLIAGVLSTVVSHEDKVPAPLAGLPSPCAALDTQTVAAYAVNPTGSEAYGSDSGPRTCAWARKPTSPTITVAYGIGQPLLAGPHTPFIGISGANMFYEYDLANHLQYCEVRWPTSYGYVSVAYLPDPKSAAATRSGTCDEDTQLALAVSLNAPG